MAGLPDHLAGNGLLYFPIVLQIILHQPSRCRGHLRPSHGMSPVVGSLGGCGDPEVRAVDAGCAREGVYREVVSGLSSHVNRPLH